MKLFCKKHDIFRTIKENRTICYPCKREKRKVWIQNNRELFNADQERYRQKHGERIKTRRKELYDKARPDVVLKRKIYGVTSLAGRKGGQWSNKQCLWEACVSENKKIYALGLCHVCYHRAMESPNAPQIQDLYAIDYFMK